MVGVVAGVGTADTLQEPDSAGMMKQGVTSMRPGKGRGKDKDV